MVLHCLVALVVAQGLGVHCLLGCEEEEEEVYLGDLTRANVGSALQSGRKVELQGYPHSAGVGWHIEGVDHHGAAGTLVVPFSEVALQASDDE